MIFYRENSFDTCTLFYVFNVFLVITCSRPVRVSTVDEIRQYTSVNSLAVAKSACLLTRKSQLCSPGLLLGIINLKVGHGVASTLQKLLNRRQTHCFCVVSTGGSPLIQRMRLTLETL